MRSPAALASLVLSASLVASLCTSRAFAAETGLEPTVVSRPTLAPAPPPAPAPLKKSRIALALAAGVVTALVPVALGGTKMANGQTDEAKNDGFVVAGVGPALAPIVSHVVIGEYARAAAFGAVPVAAEIGMGALVAAKPDAVFQGTVFSRTSFAGLFSLNLFGAAVGLVDVMLAEDRHRPPPITVGPLVGGGRYGLVLGGAL